MFLPFIKLSSRDRNNWLKFTTQFKYIVRGFFTFYIYYLQEKFYLNNIKLISTVRRYDEAKCRWLVSWDLSALDVCVEIPHDGYSVLTRLEWVSLIHSRHSSDVPEGRASCHTSSFCCCEGTNTKNIIIVSI